MEEERRRESKCFDNENDLCFLLLLILLLLVLLCSSSSSHGLHCLGFCFSCCSSASACLNLVRLYSTAAPCPKSTCLGGTGSGALGISSLLILLPQPPYPPPRDGPPVAAAAALRIPVFTPPEAVSPNQSLPARPISAVSQNTSSMRCARTLWKRRRAPHRCPGPPVTSSLLPPPQNPLPSPALPANFTTSSCDQFHRLLCCRDRPHIQNPLLEIRYQRSWSRGRIFVSIPQNLWADLCHHPGRILARRMVLVELAQLRSLHLWILYLGGMLFVALLC